MSTTQKMKFFIKDLFSKRDQRKLRIWSHLPKKSLIENFIFCAVDTNGNNPFIRCCNVKAVMSSLVRHIFRSWLCLECHFCTTDLMWSLSWNSCIFETLTFSSHGFIAEECTIKDFAEGKRSNLFSTSLIDSFVN